MRLFDALRLLSGLVVGTILYIPLSLIPLIGPIASGYAQGKAMKASPAGSLFFGMLSGVIGFLVWLYLINKVFLYEFGSLFSWIALWLFFAWNMMQALFNGLGCVFGSMVEGAKQAFSGARTQENNNAFDIDLPTFIICPSCGISNPEGSLVCASCGRSLQR